MAVIETEEFLNHAKAILTETERADLVAHLGANPEAGQLVPGTTEAPLGNRGAGQTGCARMICYYYHRSIPLFEADKRKLETAASDPRIKF